MKNGALNLKNMSKIWCVVSLNLLLSMYASLGKLPNCSVSLIPLLIQQIFIEPLIYASFCASPQAHLCFFIFKMLKKEYQPYKIVMIDC